MHDLQTPPRSRSHRRQIRRIVLHHVLHADDPPHRLALGAAIGMLVAFTPTIGLQMALVVVIAGALRANPVLGLPLVWISNPLTIVPIFYADYTVGRLLLGRESLASGWWTELAQPPAAWWDTTVFYWCRTLEVAAPLWLGSLMIGLVFGGVAYIVALVTVRECRRMWGVRAVRREQETNGSSRGMRR